MASAKAQQTPIAAGTSNAAGGTLSSAWLPIGNGVSGVTTITNGATGPTVGASFNLQVSADGGTTSDTWSSQAHVTTASAVGTFPFALAQFGGGGDFTHYRVQVTGNTGQAVTAGCNAGQSSGL